MATRFQRPIHPAWYALVTLGTIAVFVADTQTQLGIATWVFYLVPLGATFFISRPAAPIAVAGIATIGIAIAYAVSPSGIHAWIAQLNRGFALIVLWAFAILIHQVIRSRLALQQRDWLRAGQALLAQRVVGEQSLTQLGGNVMEFVASYLGAQVGALYVREEAGDSAALAAGFALPADTSRREAVHFGEGLLGQAIRSRKPMRLDDVPPDYLNISSAVGQHATAALLISPITADGEVFGALELGFLRTMHESDAEMLKLLAEPIGMAIRTAKLRTERETLLEQTQRQAAELQAQQEELRVSNEELEQQSQVLRESQARLETQQAELEQINVQLEEHTQSLARQNDDLDAARTELLAKATELERANQFKSEFLANMSHELRTPLNSALILSKLLSDNPSGNLTEEQVKFAHNIYTAGNDLLELINDVLDLSKIEARKVEVSPENVSVQQIVSAMEQTFRPVANQKRLAFEVDIDARSPQLIQTDSQRLRQILKNLLSNAFKFTSSGGVTLRVRARPAGSDHEEGIVFSVHDTGIGIPPEQQGTIFEPFRQADGTTARRFGGTGLGLSITRELAQLLGGGIELQSTQGAGSTFTLSLPARVPAPVVSTAKAESASPASALPRARVTPLGTARSKRAVSTPELAQGTRSGSAEQRSGRVLLIIEDDALFANTLCDLASALHYSCLVASTADQGIELALLHRPTAIVLDIRLPDHTGLSVLDRLKHNPATRHIPVQVISGFDDAQAALQMGAASVLRKPVDREQLVSALASLGEKAGPGERCVLVVEDNSIQRDSIRQLLQSEHVKVVAVATAAEALQHLHTSTFDCMVLDLSLPDASGFELLEKMAGDERYSFPPVIVYTARSLSIEQEEQLRRHSKSIIIKGAKSPERLLDEVTLFLHQVETTFSDEQQRLLRAARHRDSIFEGRTILLVEDDVRNVFAITRVLETQGARLHIARNGKEALTILDQAHEIELALMDIMMPEMDGLEAMRHIRSKREFARLPIIALTAKAMPDDRQKCLEAGANDYVTKPIDIEKLLSLMRIWLPQHTKVAP